MSRFEIPRSKQKKPPTRKCYVCKEEAVGSYTVDMDIAGMAFCKKHKQDVASAMLWLVIGIPEISEGVVKDAKKKKK